MRSGDGLLVVRSGYSPRLLSLVLGCLRRFLQSTFSWSLWILAGYFKASCHNLFHWSIEQLDSTLIKRRSIFATYGTCLNIFILHSSTVKLLPLTSHHKSIRSWGIKWTTRTSLMSWLRCSAWFSWNTCFPVELHKLLGDFLVLASFFGSREGLRLTGKKWLPIESTGFLNWWTHSYIFIYNSLFFS